MIAACYVAWNEAALIAESIRSVKAYVDRFIVVDGAFSTNPEAGPVGSTDGQRAVVERACAGRRLTYIVPPARLEEHQARNRYLAELELDEWALLMDADEILIADRLVMLELLASLPEAGAVSVPIYSTAILFQGYADEMSREDFETAPIISTCGHQPRIVRTSPDLRYQRDEPRPGVFTHNVLWRADELVEGSAAWIALLNRHVGQPFEGYLRDYAWESAQGAAR